MKINNQKGFVVQGIIAVIALAIIGGGIYYAKTQKANKPNNDHILVESSDLIYKYASTTRFGGTSTPTKPSITVISPNGGENFVRNSPITVSWTQSYNSSYVRVCLMSKTAGCVFELPTTNGVIGNNSVVIPSNANKFVCGDSKPTSTCYLDSGYKISVMTDSPPGVPGEFLSDYSDDYFKITNYIVN